MVTNFEIAIDTNLEFEMKENLFLFKEHCLL